MMISPSHKSVAVATPVMDVSVDVAHSTIKSAAHIISGVQSILIHEVGTGIPYGGVPAPEYSQLNCTTFSLVAADSINGSGSTMVITTPSSPIKNPPSVGSCSRSQTIDGQKLVGSKPGSSI